MRAIAVSALFVGLYPSVARGERATTQNALERLQELLEIRIEDGILNRNQIVPALVVSTRVRFEESQTWYATEALSLLTAVLGADGVRLCAACMQPRLFTKPGYLEQSSGPIGLDEVSRLDASIRGAGPPSKTAIWLDEQAGGVSLKIVNLQTSQVVWAENVDPFLQETQDTGDLLKASRDYERRARGDSLTQVFFDTAVFPGQHISLDWTDQWGETNANFTGVSLSLFDPIIGLGANYYRAFNLGTIWGMRFAPQVGAKVIMSLPSAIIEAITDEDPDQDVLDPILTAVGVVRIPIGGSNYGIFFSASTNGRVGFGISLLNISVLPVIL